MYSALLDFRDEMKNYFINDIFFMICNHSMSIIKSSSNQSIVSSLVIAMYKKVFVAVRYFFKSDVMCVALDLFV